MRNGNVAVMCGCGEVLAIPDVLPGAWSANAQCLKCGTGICHERPVRGRRSTRLSVPKASIEIVMNEMPWPQPATPKAER